MFGICYQEATVGFQKGAVAYFQKMTDRESLTTVTNRRQDVGSNAGSKSNEALTSDILLVGSNFN